MINSICNWLTSDTSGVVITLFLCLALGYAIGSLKLGPVSLGSTVGTLLIGVVVSAVVAGSATYEIPGVLRYIFFYLFIFALGYEVGPVFVRSLKSSGLKLLAMALIFTLMMLAVGIGCKFLFHLGSGELIGLYAGAATQSSVLGAAQSMMPGLGITGDAATQMNNQMTAAYALGYLISYAGCVIFIKCLLPYVVGCKGVSGLKEAVKKEVEKNGHEGSRHQPSMFSHIRLRTCRIEGSGAAAGMTIKTLEEKLEGQVVVETLMRDSAGPAGFCVDFDQDTVLEAGDVIAMVGELSQVVSLAAWGLTEVAEDQYQKAFVNKKRVVITKLPDSDEKRALLAKHVMVSEIVRDGKPLDGNPPLVKGDVVTLVGNDNYLKKVIREVGYAVDNSEDTNVIFMSWGIIAGLIVGAASITAAGVPIGLGTSGGLILLGIFCGWYNNRYPGKGYISPGALWLMKSIGLNLFVACLGLSSGAAFVSSIQQMGLPMIISLILMAFLPHVLTILVCRPLLHLSPVELLGGVCGSGTNTAALNGLTDETGSSIFAASYTPAYAMANITLTFLGVIGIALFH